jgi:hypothetical protein
MAHKPTLKRQDAYYAESPSAGEDIMDISATNPIDLSAEAALELEELRQGVRVDVPALADLFIFLRTRGPAFAGSSVSMLEDIRSYALFRDSLGSIPKKPTTFGEFRKVVDVYLQDLAAGVAQGNKEKIKEAKRFCLAFNANLVNKQMSEIYTRRERGDSRYVSHESIP